jgi:hypothetical protein
MHYISQNIFSPWIPILELNLRWRREIGSSISICVCKVYCKCLPLPGFIKSCDGLKEDHTVTTHASFWSAFFISQTYKTDLEFFQISGHFFDQFIRWPIERSFRIVFKVWPLKIRENVEMYKRLSVGNWQLPVRILRPLKSHERGSEYMTITKFKISGWEALLPE